MWWQEGHLAGGCVPCWGPTVNVGQKALGGQTGAQEQGTRIANSRFCDWDPLPYFAVAARDVREEATAAVAEAGLESNGD